MRQALNAASYEVTSVEYNYLISWWFGSIDALVAYNVGGDCGNKPEYGQDQWPARVKGGTLDDLLNSTTAIVYFSNEWPYSEWSAGVVSGFTVDYVALLLSKIADHYGVTSNITIQAKQSSNNVDDFLTTDLYGTVLPHFSAKLYGATSLSRQVAQFSCSYYAMAPGLLALDTVTDTVEEIKDDDTLVIAATSDYYSYADNVFAGSVTLYASAELAAAAVNVGSANVAYGDFSALVAFLDVNAISGYQVMIDSDQDIVQIGFQTRFDSDDNYPVTFGSGGNVFLKEALNAAIYNSLDSILAAARVWSGTSYNYAPDCGSIGTVSASPYFLDDYPTIGDAGKTALAQMLENGYATVGYGPFAAPLYFINESGETDGVLVDIVNVILATLASHYSGTLDQSIVQNNATDASFLKAGLYAYRAPTVAGVNIPFDFSARPFTAQQDQAQIVDFPCHIFSSYTAVITADDSLTQTQLNADNITFAVQRGSDYESIVGDMFPLANVDLYNSAEAALAAVASGSADVSCHSLETLTYLLTLSGEKGLTVKRLSGAPVYAYSLQLRYDNWNFSKSYEEIKLTAIPNPGEGKELAIFDVDHQLVAQGFTTVHGYVYISIPVGAYYVYYEGDLASALAVVPGMTTFPVPIIPDVIRKHLKLIALVALAGLGVIAVLVLVCVIWCCCRRKNRAHVVRVAPK